MESASAPLLSKPKIDPGRAADFEEHAKLRTYDGTVDYKGRPANKACTGGWSITPYICAIEVTEKVATSGAQFNIVTYLVQDKKLPLPYAANMVTNFMGSSFLFSLLGGFVADTFLGRYFTLMGSAIIQMLGFLTMVFSVVIPALNNQEDECHDPANCKPVHGWGLASIYVGLYLIALGIGGVKSTGSGFGADQFEADDPKESQQLPRFFTWFYWATTIGSLTAATSLIYLQDNVGWDWGYGILIIIMFLAVLLLVSLRRRFRYRVPKGSPLFIIARVIVASINNWHLEPLTEKEVSKYYDHLRCMGEKRFPIRTKSLRFLDKAAKLPITYSGNSKEKLSPWRYATISEVEDVKMLLRLLPVWLFTIFYWTVLAQATTFGVAQAATTDRSLGPSFIVPQGSVGSVVFNLTIILFLPMYDRFFLPVMRRFTGQAKGMTVLQKIGVGMISPFLSMVVAALVERKRLGVVKQMHLENDPLTVLPFSMWWVVPQYVIIALGEAFVYPGQLEFFYTEAPHNMQSMGTSLMACTIAVGYFSSNAIVTAVNSFTGTKGSIGWLQKNVNESRLDKYYWLLASMSAINFSIYVLVSRLHLYKQVPSTSAPEGSSEARSLLVDYPQPEQSSQPTALLADCADWQKPQKLQDLLRDRQETNVNEHSRTSGLGKGTTEIIVARESS